MLKKQTATRQCSQKSFFKFVPSTVRTDAVEHLLRTKRDFFLALFAASDSCFQVVHGSRLRTPRAILMRGRNNLSSRPEIATLLSCFLNSTVCQIRQERPCFLAVGEWTFIKLTEMQEDLVMAQHKKLTSELQILCLFTPTNAQRQCEYVNQNVSRGKDRRANENSQRCTLTDCFEMDTWNEGFLFCFSGNWQKLYEKTWNCLPWPETGKLNNYES